MHVLGVACRRPPVNRRVVAVDRIVNAVFAKCHSNIIADLDKVGISRIEGIYAPTNVRSHFLCAVKKEHCTTSGFHSTASNGDFTTCAASFTVLIPTANTSATTITCFLGVAVATICSYLTVVNVNGTTIAHKATADTSGTKFATGSVYDRISTLDGNGTAIAFRTAADTGTTPRTNRCYIAAGNGDGAASSTAVAAAAPNACTVVCFAAFRHHRTVSDSDAATIAIRSATDGCAIGCFYSTSRIHAACSNMSTIDSDFATTTMIATADACTAALTRCGTPGRSHSTAINGDCSAVPAITAANTRTIFPASGGYNGCTCSVIDLDRTAVTTTATTNTRAVLAAGGGHIAASDFDVAASATIAATNTCSTALNGCHTVSPGGGHCTAIDGNAVTANTSGIFGTGGCYRAAIDEDFAHSSVNTTICCIHNTTIDGDGAVCSSDVRSTITTCFNLTAVDGNSTAITIDSCSERAYIPFSRFGHDWLGIDGQANTIVHRDTLGF